MPELFPFFQPGDLKVVVVEKDGAIVARLSYMRAPMLEGFWIEPTQRGNAGVFRALLKGICTVMREDGYGWAYAQAAEPHVADLIERAGGRKMPVDTYVLAVGE